VKRTVASKVRRARSVFISSATVRRIRTVTAFVRHPSSTSRCSKTCVSVTVSLTPSWSSAASISSSGKWTA